MSSLLTTKTLGIVGGIAGVSAVGGGVAYGTGLFSDSKPQKILLINNRTKLEAAGFEVLNAVATNPEWQKVFDEYHKAKKGTFKGEDIADTEKTKEQLIQECQSQLDLNTDASYKLTRQWCVKQETMNAILSKKSRVLNSDTGTSDDNTTWSTKISSLTANEKTTLGLNADANDVATIKAKCKEATDKKTTDAEFNGKFEVAKKVCTV